MFSTVGLPPRQRRHDPDVLFIVGGSTVARAASSRATKVYGDR
jgi:hypothetical protein